MPPKFRELSSFDQFRVCWYLTRGDSPDDPELAAVTLGAARGYQIRSRALTALLGWWPVVLAVVLIAWVLPGALSGQAGMVFLLLLIVMGVVANFLLNPWTRPKNVAKSMEAAGLTAAQTR